MHSVSICVYRYIVFPYVCICGLLKTRVNCMIHCPGYVGVCGNKRADSLVSRAPINGPRVLPIGKCIELIHYE